LKQAGGSFLFANLSRASKDRQRRDVLKIWSSTKQVPQACGVQSEADLRFCAWENESRTLGHIRVETDCAHSAKEGQRTVQGKAKKTEPCTGLGKTRLSLTLASASAFVHRTDTSNFLLVLRRIDDVQLRTRSMGQSVRCIDARTSTALRIACGLSNSIAAVEKARATQCA
jgi:hypothetical protein